MSTTVVLEGTFPTIEEEAADFTVEVWSGVGDATSLRGYPVSATAPAAGEALVWTGTAWAPANIGTQVELDALTASLAAHAARVDNPHAVTAAQVGAYSTAEADTLLAAKASAAGLAAHIADAANPHAVTKAQVGLGNVENTALTAWAGSANITTLGTVATGVWNATAITWAKVDKAGSSLADLDTRSAADLTSGALAYARLPTGGGTWGLGGSLTISGGALLFSADNTLDVGAASARPRDLVLGRDIYVGGDLLLTSGKALYVGSASAANLRFSWNANNAVFRSGAVNIQFQDNGGTNILSLAHTGRTATFSGNVLFSSDNAFDVGATAASRPRDVNVGRNLVVAGTATFSSDVDILGSSARTLNVTVTSNSQHPVIGMRRQRTTGGTTQDADYLLQLIGYGFNSGGAYAGAAEINVQQDGAASATKVPGRIVFSTSPGGSTSPTERWRVTPTGVFQSPGAQTIQTATGALTIATAAGDGDVIISPNGTGRLRFGTHTVLGAEVLSGYVMIKDAGGTSRKLAVIA